MYKNKFNFLVCILLITSLLTSCSTKRKQPDISKVKVELKVLRFEKDLFSSDFEKVADSIPFFNNKYGEFFNIFNYKIIQLGSSKSASYPGLLKGFLTDYNINQIVKATDTAFSNFDIYEKQLNEAFRYYKYYFPKQSIPTIITYISGFNQTMVSTDTILGIGIDRYLGSNSEFYHRMQLPNYITANMFKGKIVTDCMRAWAMTQFPMSDSASNLLSNIIYLGKIVYFTKAILPNAPDSLVFGLSNIQLEWCKINEQQMWTYLVEYKMLFKTDYFTINKFIGDGPFTKDFGPNSPAKAVSWLGWKIVNSLMEKKSEVSLPQLMYENDNQQILRMSKYKP